CCSRRRREHACGGLRETVGLLRSRPMDGRSRIGKSRALIGLRMRKRILYDVSGDGPYLPLISPTPGCGRAGLFAGWKDGGTPSLKNPQCSVRFRSVPGSPSLSRDERFLYFLRQDTPKRRVVLVDGLF